MRIIFLLTPLLSNVSAFTNNSLLNISQIPNLKTALFMFLYDFNSLPKIFSGFLYQAIILNQLIHRRHIPNHLRSSSAIHLHQPVHRSSIVNRGFTYASPAIWNDLPPIIRSQPTLELFRRQLKTHLFKIALDGEPRRL